MYVCMYIWAYMYMHIFINIYTSKGKWGEGMGGGVRVQQK